MDWLGIIFVQTQKTCVKNKESKSQRIKHICVSQQNDAGGRRRRNCFWSGRSAWQWEKVIMGLGMDPALYKDTVIGSCIFCSGECQWFLLLFGRGYFGGGGGGELLSTLNRNELFWVCIAKTNVYLKWSVAFWVCVCVVLIKSVITVFSSSSLFPIDVLPWMLSSWLSVTLYKIFDITPTRCAAWVTHWLLLLDLGTVVPYCCRSDVFVSCPWPYYECALLSHA